MDKKEKKNTNDRAQDTLRKQKPGQHELRQLMGMIKFKK